MQLEFNLDNKSEADFKMDILQKQIDHAIDSMGKVRRKLFKQMGELEKEVAKLKAENEVLKEKVNPKIVEKIEWDYKKEGCLFDVREPQLACG